MDAPLPRGRSRAFSLIELLVVVAVIAILLAILLPALGKVRSRARTATCLSNLNKIGTAVHLYAGDNNDYTPPRGIDAANTPNAPPGFGPPHYPPTERAVWSDQNILGQYVGSTNGDNLHPAYTNTLVKQRSPLICPSDTFHPVGVNMHVSYGMGTNFPYVNPIDRYKNFWKTTAVKDHATQLVAVDCAEYVFAPGGWTEPYYFYGTPDDAPDRTWNNGEPNSRLNWAKRHNGGGANVLFLDGSARYFDDLKPAYERKEIALRALDEH